MRSPDEHARSAVRARAARTLRPAGALATLDEIAVWLAGWQRTERPAVRRPACVVFVADHGVAAENVSAYPQSITKDVLRALETGVATAPVMARTLGVSFRVVDAGVGRPTGNIRVEPAMDPVRFAECMALGAEAVPDADLLTLGEMGIGNTTVAAAVAARLFGGHPEEWVGRGTGIDDETLARKVVVVEDARTRVGPDTPPLEVLRELGGSELAAIAGAVLEARRRSIPVILDGFVATAAVAPLRAADPSALDHCLAGHVSSEPGHRRLLQHLGLTPLLDLSMRLGEASGALAAIPLVRLAAACAVEVATFD